MTRQQRLQEYFDRLARQPLSTTAEDALRKMEQTLIEVEDEMSGIPRSDPPPPRERPDGRMYPPQEDHIVRHADGSITAITRKQEVLIGSDGSITIINRKTAKVDFHQDGAGA